MNIKALITTLAIVGSSSVAMARPATTVVSANAQFTASASWGFGGNSRARVRDHRTPARWSQVGYDDRADDRDFGRDYNDNWAGYSRFDLLADNLNFGAGEYRKDIMPSAAERFSKLRIEADRGSTYLMKVVVEFADGTAQQQINLDRTLRAGAALELDLTGSTHTISRILVYRADNYDLRHFNEVHRGEFSVLAL